MSYPASERRGPEPISTILPGVMDSLRSLRARRAGVRFMAYDFQGGPDLYVRIVSPYPLRRRLLEGSAEALRGLAIRAANDVQDLVNRGLLTQEEGEAMHAENRGVLEAPAGTYASMGSSPWTPPRSERVSAARGAAPL